MPRFRSRFLAAVLVALSITTFLSVPVHAATTADTAASL